MAGVVEIAAPAPVEDGGAVEVAQAFDEAVKGGAGAVELLAQPGLGKRLAMAGEQGM